MTASEPARRLSGRDGAMDPVTLLGLVMGARYDGADSVLDPRRGFRPLKHRNRQQGYKRNSKQHERGVGKLEHEVPPRRQFGFIHARECFNRLRESPSVLARANQGDLSGRDG